MFVIAFVVAFVVAAGLVVAYRAAGLVLESCFHTGRSLWFVLYGPAEFLSFAVLFFPV